MISWQHSTRDAEVLKAVKLIRPSGAGGEWRGMKHSELVELLQEASYLSGNAPDEARFSVGRGGQDLIAGWTCAGNRRGVRWGFAVEASNAMRKLMRVYCGVVADGTTLVCKSFHGWRYCKSLDFDHEAIRVVEEWRGNCYLLEDEVAARRRNPVTQDDVSLLLMEAGRKKIIPWRHVGRVDRMWREGKDPTEWGLVKAFWADLAENSQAKEQLHSSLLFREVLFKGVRHLRRPQTI